MKFYKTQGGAIVEAVEERFLQVEGLDEVEPNSVDAAVEKHVPVIVADGDGVLIKVGEVPHPMESEHFIMWIEVERDGEVQRKYLSPGDAPEAHFSLPADGLTAYIFCNLHGLWKSK